MTSNRPGEFELFVLLAALHLGPEEAYAVSIADTIGDRTGRSVRRSNVYTALRRLEERGQVATQLSEPRPERGGKARRLVNVTPEGVAAVQRSTRELQAMVGELDGLLGESA